MKGGPEARVKDSKDGGKSTITLGNHDIPKVSTATADYTAKEINSNHLAMPRQENSPLVFGEHDSVLETVNQHYFDKKQIERTKLPMETIKELRKSHFNLGNAGNVFKTESEKYQAYPNLSSNKVDIAQPETGSWQPKMAPFMGTSTNRR